MNHDDVAALIAQVYDHWPNSVSTSSEKSDYDDPSYISKLFQTYETVEESLSNKIKNSRIYLMAGVINWVLFRRIQELSRDRNIINPNSIPIADLLPGLEEHLDEETLQPEIHSIVCYISKL